jgi:3-oxoacyl-[acyl-carrier-protein] synthase-3
VDSRKNRYSRKKTHIIRGEDTTTSMGVKAAEIAIERSGLAKKILIVFCNTKPDYYFPGPGVLGTT